MKTKSLKSKLLTAISPMVLLLLVMIATYTVIYSGQISDLKRMVYQIDESTYISNVVHELQKERGYSAGYISSNGEKFKQELKNQYTSTDKAIKELNHYLVEDKKNIGVIGTYLKDLENHRNAVQNVETSLKDAVTYYTTIITVSLNVINKNSDIITDIDIENDYITFNKLLLAKEASGIERAYGSAGFNKEVFPLELYKKALLLQGKQETNLNASDNPKLKGLIEDFIKSNENKLVESYRDSMLVSIKESKKTAVSSKEWFNAATHRINLLKQDEIKITTILKSEARKNYKEILIKVILNSFIGLIIVGISLFLAISVITKFTRILLKQINIMEEIAKNNADIEITDNSYTEETEFISHSLITFKEQLLERIKLREGKEKEKERELQQKEREAALQKETALKLQQESQGHLEGIVDISLKTNKAVTHISSLSFNLTAVTNQTEVISAAIKQLSSSINHVNETSISVAESSAQMVEVVDNGSIKTDEAAQLMDEINNAVDTAAEQVEKLISYGDMISDMVDSIDEIAEQTHLLALNASIEAVRAGESGKGFVVVADEVKNLANQTTKVTDEVRNRVKLLTTEMVDVNESMVKTSKVVDNGIEHIDVLKTTMEDITVNAYKVKEFSVMIDTIISEERVAVSEINNETTNIKQEVTKTNKYMDEAVTALDLATKSVDDRISIFEDLNTDISILELAKNDHSKFFKRVLNTLIEKDNWNSEEVPDYHNCRLGEWYYSKAKNNIKSSTEYKELEAIHEQVHSITKDILFLNQSGNVQQAFETLNDLIALSDKVVSALNALKLKVQ